MIVNARVRFAVAAIAGAIAFPLAATTLDPGLLRGGEELSLADSEAIRAVLGDYNRIYQDFFASGGIPARLNDFPATTELRHQVFRDIGFVRDAGLVLPQDLAEAVVREIRSAGPGAAEAIVYEEWNYVYQQSADRRPVSRPKGHGQGFRYVLRRSGDRWVVTAWDLEELPAPERKQERLW